jgi:hypothetical protein
MSTAATYTDIILVSSLDCHEMENHDDDAVLLTNTTRLGHPDIHTRSAHFSTTLPYYFCCCCCCSSTTTSSWSFSCVGGCCFGWWCGFFIIMFFNNNSKLTKNIKRGCPVATTSASSSLKACKLDKGKASWRLEFLPLRVHWWEQWKDLPWWVRWWEQG